MPGTRERKRKDEFPPTVDDDRVEATKKIRTVAREGLEGSVTDAEALVTETEPILTDEVVDGDLKVDCLDAMQGDCTLITTPGGRRIMIDCGIQPRLTNANLDPGIKDRRLQAMRDAVSDFLGEGLYLDVLVLTHPDLDHNNAIKDCLLLTMRVGSVYYSGQFGQYQRGTQERLRAIIDPTTEDPTQSGAPKQVLCRWTPGSGLTTTQVALYTDGTEAAYGADDGAIDVRDTTACLIKILVEPKCTVSILAAGLERASYGVVQDTGDVEVGDGDQDGTNCASIVTLVEAHGKKLLFCGDATCSTEQFLIDKHDTRIADLELLRVAHHGSGETSSTKSFIETVKARTAVISAGQRFSMYHHPRWAAVRRYLNEFKSRVPLTPPDAHGALPLDIWHRFSAEERDLAGPPASSADRQSLGVNKLTPLPSGTGTLYDTRLGYPLQRTPYSHIVANPTDGLRDAVLAPAQSIEEGVR